MKADDFLGNSVADGAKWALLGLMAGISQDNFCSCWERWLEFDLWNIPAGRWYGQNEITERQSTLLRLLAAEADGWWVWEGEGGAKFLTTDNWLILLRDRK